MSEIDFYLTQDHDARGRTMFISIVGGAMAGGLTQLVGFSFQVSVVFCVFVIAAVELYRAYTYEAPNRKNRRLIKSLPIKHRLIATAWCALALLLVASLPKIATVALDRSLQTVSAATTDTQSVEKTTRILDRARNARLKLSPATLQRVGKELVNAADKTPGAWEAALDTIGYQSVNQSQRPLGTLNPHPEPTHYQIMGTPNRPPKVASYGNVPRSEAAQMYKIGSQDANQRQERGDAALVVQDADGLLLDGMHMRNIVFQNSSIMYEGGPVELDHVSFLNCTFHITNNQNGQKLANALLTSPQALTFTAK